MSPPTPPISTKTSLGQGLSAHTHLRWPGMDRVEIRFRGQFAYVTGLLPEGEVLPLCRLRYGGSASSWGFAIYRASQDDYQVSLLPSGHATGSPEEASTASADSTSTVPPPGNRAPTN